MNAIIKNPLQPSNACRHARPTIADIVVTAMTENDIPAVAALEASCFHDPWTTAMLHGSLADPLGIHLVARCSDGEGTAVCGYVCGIVVADECALYRICSAPAFRRRRIGTLLLHGFIRKAVCRGAIGCFLEVGAGNNAALEFYRRHGFYECGRRPGYYADSHNDALILQTRCRDLVCAATSERDHPAGGDA